MKKPLKENRTDNKSTEQERARKPKGKGKSPIALMNSKNDSKKSEKDKEEVKRGN